MNAADLAVFDALFSSMAEEMGEALVRAATSTNIKERRDLSCALFTGDGALIAQAAHIPVHLGAMPMSVRAALAAQPLDEGDVVILNDPWRGGTHLPDVTAIRRVGPVIVANRAHHADIGGGAPGSLGLARDIFGEGLRIPPVRLVRGGVVDDDLLELFCANVRAPRERREDLMAQVATLQRGAARWNEAADRFGAKRLLDAARALRTATSEVVARTLAGLKSGGFTWLDEMDGGHAIQAALRVENETLVADFQGTAPQAALPINANLAVTTSAVGYALALLLPPSTPLNEGLHDRLNVRAPEGSLVNARYPAAVAGGNVETSQRIVDVVLGALSYMTERVVPAASQGTMNNLTIGGSSFSYYETMGGGAGAAPGRPGASAIQTHMTNTRNTPIEAFEHEYPLLVRRLAVARGTGGAGATRGGDGLEKVIEFREESVVHLLTDRRETRPYGLDGGEPGTPGAAWVVRKDENSEQPVAGRARIEVGPGDRLRIRTPGGGGYGRP